jgi:hypothetical protein
VCGTAMFWEDGKKQVWKRNQGSSSWLGQFYLPHRPVPIGSLSLLPLIRPSYVVTVHTSVCNNKNVHEEFVLTWKYIIISSLNMINNFSYQGCTQL